jgi:hypothetical protein
MKKVEDKSKSIDKTEESAENADFFVNVDDLPARAKPLHFMNEQDSTLSSKDEDEQYRPKSESELQRVLTESFQADFRDKGPLPFLLSAILLGIFYFVGTDSIDNTVGQSKELNIITGLVAGGLASYLSLVKILYPVWVILIFKKFPFSKPSIYLLKFNYLYIQTFDKLTYKSNITRVRIAWSRITSVEYKQGKLFAYLELKDSRQELVGCIRWDFNNIQEVIKGIKFFTDIDHPLNKFVCSLST